MATTQTPDLSLGTWGPEGTKKFTEGFEASRRKKEERAQRLREPFELEVSICHCGGPVIFDFKGMQPVGPMLQVRLGGHNEMEEVFRLACKSCGAAFDVEHPPIAQKIKEYRDKL